MVRAQFTVQREEMNSFIKDVGIQRDPRSVLKSLKGESRVERDGGLDEGFPFFFFRSQTFRLRG